MSKRMTFAQAFKVTDQRSEAKYDSGKPNWSLMPLKTIEMIVRVMDFGAAKYGVGSWKSLPNAQERYSAALLRHLTAWQDGESIDQESGLPHLAHVACNAVFLLWFELKK